tara:strand:- start:1759 stop:2985 length:1227 start_codon:yes stop_codon:yes gene_type:complete
MKPLIVKLNLPFMKKKLSKNNQYHEESIEKAAKIAKETLKMTFTDDGISAGKSHFSDLWVRDACYAGIGALSCEFNNEVKRSIETMSTHCKDNGQIPLRVGSKYFFLKYLGLSKKNKDPMYFEDKYSGSVPMDSNSLFIILLHEYVKKTKDIAFLEHHFFIALKAINWLILHTNKKDLLTEGNYSGWADSLKKKGMVLYTNVLYLKSLQSMFELSNLLDQEHLSHRFQKRYLSSLDKFNACFWKETHYIDTIPTKERGIFSTDGNLLAIYFDIATPSQINQIFSTISSLNMDTDFCIETNSPKYPMNMIYAPFYLIRLHDYHNGLRWLWLEALYIICKEKCGFQHEARRRLFELSKKIVEFNGIYEVYEKNGPPVKRLFYKSESYFSWSSGLFLAAYNACKKIELPLN